MAKNSPAISNSSMQKSTFALGPNNVSEFSSTAHSNYQPVELVPLTDGKPRAAHINHSTLLLGKNNEPIVSTAKVAFQEPIDPPHYQKVTKNLQASTFSIGTSKLDDALVSTQQANFSAPDPNYHIDHQNPELKASHLQFKEISPEEDKKLRRASTAFEQYRDPHIEHVPELHHMDLQKGSGAIQGNEKLVNWDTTTRQTFKGLRGSPVSSKSTDQYSRQSHFEMGRDPMPNKSTTKDTYVKYTSSVQPPRHKGDIEKSTVEIGDPSRVKEVESTQRQSFPKYDQNLVPIQHPNTAAMRETHFLMGKYLPEYNTTAHDNYKSHKIEPQEKHYMNLQKGSDTIPNDRNKFNEMTTTTQASYQPVSPKQVVRSQPVREKEWLRGTHFELGKDRANFNSTTETTFQEYGVPSYHPAPNRNNHTTLVLGDKKKWKDYETSAKASYGTPSPQPIQSLYDKDWIKSTHFRLGGDKYQLESSYNYQYSASV